MQPSTFIATKAPCSIRPSWVTHLAKLGRLLGEEITLVGVCRDWHVEAGLVDFGLATSADVSRIEGRLGSPDSLFDQGRTIDAVVRLEPRILIDLRQPEEVHRVSLRGSHNQPYTTSATQERDFVDRLAQQEAARSGFEALRQKALSRRTRWSIEDMRHREDFAPWIPDWVQTLVREESRHWLTLPPTLPVSTKRLTATNTR